MRKSSQLEESVELYLSIFISRRNKDLKRSQLSEPGKGCRGVEKKNSFDMQTHNQNVALKDFSQGARERCSRRKREGGRQTLPSFRSLETLELLWELSELY